MKMVFRFGVDSCPPSPDYSATHMSIADSSRADAVSDVYIL